MRERERERERERARERESERESERERARERETERARERDHGMGPHRIGGAKPDQLPYKTVHDMRDGKHQALTGLTDESLAGAVPTSLRPDP